ncbi:hypothetical protein ES703_35792 [subsurface metagenome]
MRVSTFIILAFVCIQTQKAQNINISVFGEKEINSIVVNIKQGKYLLKKGKETLGEYKKGNIFHISRFGNELEIRDKRNFIGNFIEIELICTSGSGILNVKPVNPVAEGREYDDNLIMTCTDKQIRIINKLDLEKYIASVLEAEGGNHAPSEYYKAQAILIRTFAIKNMLKHAEEGFNLCDAVHCQAFKGRSTSNSLIQYATQSTSGKVLIDNESVVIMSPFHSNCGGETSTAGQVWLKDLPYLQSVKDPFCLRSSNASWAQSINRKDWINFINSSKSNTINYENYNFTFHSPHRTKFVLINGININLRTVRETFHLKSAFFSVKDTGEEIIISGRGYGHGVGMCQQGAMEMAAVGYTCLDILHFYFHDVKIADYHEIELHRFKPE